MKIASGSPGGGVSWEWLGTRGGPGTKGSQMILQIMFYDDAQMFSENRIRK